MNKEIPFLGDFCLIRRRLNNELKIMEDEEFEGILKDAEKQLKQTQLYGTFAEAFSHWNKMKKNKKGICSKCGAIGKTVYHHKNHLLKPKRVYSGLKYNKMFGRKKTAKTKGVEGVLQEYIEFYGIENIKQSSLYYSVNFKEIEELCSLCHAREHLKINHEKENMKNG